MLNSTSKNFKPFDLKAVSKFASTENQSLVVAGSTERSQSGNYLLNEVAVDMGQGETRKVNYLEVYGPNKVSGVAGKVALLLEKSSDYDSECMRETPVRAAQSNILLIFNSLPAQT